MKKTCLVLICVAMLSACSSPQKDFKKAQDQDTEAAYQNYLRKYSDGPFAQQARDRIAVIEAEDAWKQLDVANTTPEALEEYARKYPQSAHANEATERVIATRRATAWDKARTENSLESLQMFVQQYPEGVEADQARAQIDQMNAANSKVMSSKAAAQTASTAVAKERLLSKHPETIHADSHAESHIDSKSSGGSEHVQLGAFHDKAAADHLKAQLQSKYGKLLGNVTVTKSNDVYRVRSGGLSESAAKAACAHLKSDHVACIPSAG
jgi:outer membrane protein assembly factor BamD (BamD/ComL family)